MTITWGADLVEAFIPQESAREEAPAGNCREERSRAGIQLPPIWESNQGGAVEVAQPPQHVAQHAFRYLSGACGGNN